MQKRSFNTSKRRKLKEKKHRSNKEEEVKTRNGFVGEKLKWATKPTKLETET